MGKCNKCWFLMKGTKCWCNMWQFKWPSLEKKKPKPIPQVSEKKKKENKERIEKNWSYPEVFARRFKQLVKAKKNFCMVTGEEITPEYMAHLEETTEWMQLNCFPHILAKWKYPEFAYFLNNIGFCKPDKHKDFDMVVAMIIDDIGKIELERKIAAWEEIDVRRYANLLNDF